MTAPIRIEERYELFRIVTDYEALQDGFLDRLDDLDTTMALPSFADGVVQKLLTKNPGKRVQKAKNCRFNDARRTFGWESLRKMLNDTGLALVLVVDDERFAETKKQLVKRRKPRQQANGRSARPKWLFTRRNAKKMGQKRWEGVSDLERARLTRKAGKASAAARCRRARAASERDHVSRISLVALGATQDGAMLRD